MLRRTCRVDGVEVDRSLPRDAIRALRTATKGTVFSKAAFAPLEARTAALGARDRRYAVDASTGVPRPRQTGGGRSRAPCSKFHQCSAKTDPVSPENSSESKKKPPAAMIPGDESYQ